MLMVYGGQFPCPEWIVASANDVMHQSTDDIRGPDTLQDSEQLAVGGQKHCPGWLKKMVGLARRVLYGPNL